MRCYRSADFALANGGVLPELVQMHLALGTLNAAGDNAVIVLHGLTTGPASMPPQAFGNVVSHCGAFVNLRGGNAWPDTIRRSPAKPLRVFLQDGWNDLDIVFGHWLHANRQMAAALAYAGVEHRRVVGSGGHSLKHGGALLPDTLRWLWGRAD